MSDVTISPNMGLPGPLVGVDPGPDWANNLNSCLGILDQHNHAAGSGVQITPSGLNINADLSINSNNLTAVKTVNFNDQGSSLPGSSPNLGCVYVAGSELYYNDEVGNVVQITNGGSVNAGSGSITGLPSGTASASYSAGSKTFIWQSSTSTPANMDFGSAIFRNIVASSFGLTLNPPNAMGADYDVTLPPSNSSGGTAFLTYDTSNNIGVGVQVSQGITAANIANNTITPAQVVTDDFFPSSEVWVRDSDTGSASYGSVNTTVRRFLTTQVNAGTDISYSDSATLGGKWTINTNGTYTISYSDNFSNNNQSFAVILNGTEGSTQVDLITNKIDALAISENLTATALGSISVTLHLTAGDYLWAQSGGSFPPGSGAGFTGFRIVRVT